MLDMIASVVTCAHRLVPAKGAANAETLATDHKSPAVESTGAIGALWEVQYQTDRDKKRTKGRAKFTWWT